MAAASTASSATSVPAPADVVRRFWIALQTGDARGAAHLLDDDVVWRNTGLPTLRGARAAATLTMLERRGVEVEVTIHHLAADGPVVLTDRTDTIRVGRCSSTFAVQGTFEVRDGLIVRWEDHFNWGEATLGTVRGSVGGLAAAVAAGLAGRLPGRTGPTR